MAQENGPLWYQGPGISTAPTMTAAKKPVKNVDLWQQLEDEVTQHRIDWNWVKGHAGIEDNELADQLANAAIDEKMQA